MQNNEPNEALTFVIHVFAMSIKVVLSNLKQTPNSTQYFSETNVCVSCADADGG